MNIHRTPDDHFNDLPDFPFEPHYLEVTAAGTDQAVRIHYVDEGPSDAAPVLMLHGEPSWSYLYRKVIPPVVAAGQRVIVPDLVGFGRSDKPADTADYTYQRHVDWIRGLLEGLDLRGITLLCQDWGGLIGLRLAAEEGDRFDRIVAANTFLPTGDAEMPRAFKVWRRAAKMMPVFTVGTVIQQGTVNTIPDDILAAYKAPFPAEKYKAGARIFPQLVPASPDDPAVPANRAAWEQLKSWEKPFLTAFSDGDPITRRLDILLQRYIPGAKGQPHTTIKGGGHFLQEDQGEALAQVLVDFIAAT